MPSAHANKRLSAMADIDGDWDMEIAVPSDSRATMRIIDYRDGLVEVASIRLPARVEGPVLAEGSGAKGAVYCSPQGWFGHRPFKVNRTHLF